MPKANLRFPAAWTWTPILKRIATNLGLSVEPLDSIFPITDVGLIRDRSVWMEMPLGGWMVAFRIVEQRGKPIVAELRIFPLETDSKRKRPAGQWTGMYGDKSHVPRGGITSRFLRGVKTKEFRSALREIHSRYAKELIDLEVPSGRPTPPPTAKRGRKGRSDSELARIAEIYERAYLDNLPAVKAVANNLGVPLSQARDAISRARVRGFLSPASKQGQVGGTVTLLGKEILKQSKKGASHGTKR